MIVWNKVPAEIFIPHAYLISAVSLLLQLARSQWLMLTPWSATWSKKRRGRNVWCVDPWIWPPRRGTAAICPTIPHLLGSTTSLPDPLPLLCAVEIMTPLTAGKLIQLVDTIHAWLWGSYFSRVKLQVTGVSQIIFMSMKFPYACTMAKPHAH